MHIERRTEILKNAEIRTPAFVIDTGALQEDAQLARELLDDAQTHLLFAMKSFSLAAGLQYLAEKVDGFAASSLFEARLARRILQAQQTVHLTTPGLRADELASVIELTDYLSFNSIGQWLRFKDITKDRLSCGLRINPQLSFVRDARYDPCRPASKLGVPLDQLRGLLQTSPRQLDGIRGIHFHSNCDSRDLAPLSATVDHLLDTLEPLFDRIEWINLGGGYLFNDARDSEVLRQVKENLDSRGKYRIFAEPGAALVRRSGCFVTSVMDLFSSDRQQVAVLDTSVNHMPEVFEYQFAPDVTGDAEDNEFSYLLAGSACLAGDVFGEYAFAEPLETGSRVIFPDMGAYSMVKANMFNGINLPTIYLLHSDGTLERVKRFCFEDYLTLCGI
jgi:carboxynorspermidine decarboxylase